jgi:threonine dehydrogenase-like Zn-dependent dehydrogenase
MRAITIRPGRQGAVELEEVDLPSGAGDVLARVLAVGVCGTDREIIAGEYGEAPEGDDRLIIGHEALAEVIEAPRSSGLSTGDLVVGIVRRPDPVPCESCAAGEWDMCRNGRYRERGIRGLHGFAAEQVRIEAAFTIRVERKLGLSGVLLEPASVVAKAWEHIVRIGERTQSWTPKRVLVTGSGPVGLLAAMMARQRGFDVHVYDRVTSGPKPALVRELQATYHAAASCDDVVRSLRPGIVIECTGAAPVILDVMENSAPSGVVCLAGLSSGAHKLKFDVNLLNRRIVLENDVVFGTVNANRRLYEAAAAALSSAQPEWLDSLVTRRVPLSRWQEAFERREGDVKVVLQFDA